LTHTESKHYQSSSWLQNKAEQLCKRFGWRGGCERHTKGIWIWSEPFFFTTPKDGKVSHIKR